MPVVGISIDNLKNKIGNNLNTEQIEKCCQEIGCDVDELTFINRIKCAQCHNVIEYSQNEALPKKCDYCQHEFNEENNDYSTLEKTEVITL